MQKNKSVTITNILFAAIVSIFFSIGAFLVISTVTFKVNAEEVMALITDMIPYEDSEGDTSYEVEVEYEYEGFTFSAVLDTYSSGMREGKWIPILVNKDDPMDIVEPGTNLGLGIGFMVLGGIAILVGGVSFIKEQKHKKKIENLRKNGKRLQARIDQITINKNIAVNEEHPYIIWCSYVDEFSGARADTIIHVTSPSLKTMCYYASNADQFESLSNSALQIMNIQDKDIYLPLQEVNNHFKGIPYMLPYCRDIKQQAITGTLAQMLPYRAYRAVVKEIAKAVM